MPLLLLKLLRLTLLAAFAYRLHRELVRSLRNWGS